MRRINRGRFTMRSNRFNGLFLLSLLFLGARSPLPAVTGEPAGGTAPFRTDCRYEPPPGARDTEGEMVSVLLPPNDLFRPLIADMKQPRFYAGFRRVRFLGRGLPTEEEGDVITAGVVGFGGNFGLWGKRRVGGCDGLQINIHAGMFSQFNMSTSSVDLINSDFIVGIPLTCRRGRFSARLRLFHQSSHLGDEFFLNNPGVDRVDISFEASDLLISVEGEWWRLYGGGGRLIHFTPDLEPGMAQWGFEFCGAGWNWTLLRQALLKPVFAADFTSFEERNWVVTTSTKGGFEMKSLIGQQRFRLFLVYLQGYVPFGQFFSSEKIRNYGIEIQFEI